MSRMADILRNAIPGWARNALLVAPVVMVILAGVLGVRAWFREHEDRLRMQATIAAQQQVISAAEKREQQRGQELKDALAQITELKNSVSTPQQVVRELPQYLPLPQPIQIIAPHPQAPPAQPGDAQPRGLGAPAEKPVAQMPVEDLKPLFDFVQDCRACKLQLAAAQADLKDEQAKMDALAKQRDAAVKAARGTFWSRLRHGAKWFVIGGAVGAAAVAAAR